MTLPAIATAQEVAAYLRVSPQFVYEHADEIGAARIGRCVRLPAENVLRRIEACARAQA